MTLRNANLNRLVTAGTIEEKIYQRQVTFAVYLLLVPTSANESGRR